METPQPIAYSRLRRFAEGLVSYSSDPAINTLLRLHKSGRASFTLTMAGRIDGGGAQVQAAMSVQALCLAHGIPYAHTPLSIVDHAHHPDAAAEWETAVGLGLDHPRIDGGASLPAHAFIRDPKLWNSDAIIRIPGAEKVIRRQPELYRPVAAALRKNLREPHPAPSHGLTCAIHVRRGDVGADKHKRRFTPTEKLVPAIATISQAAQRAQSEVVFDVFSNGTSNELEPLVDAGCRLQLDADPLESLKALARADIVVTAKSSFSYVAGLLSGGVVLYEDYWNPPLPEWISLRRIERRTDEIATRLGTLKRTDPLIPS